MEPLFESEMTVDTAVLEEWQRGELGTAYRGIYVMYGLLLMLCLVLAAATAAIALQLGAVAAWALVALFVALFGVLAWTVATLPRRLVKNALKKEAGAAPYRCAALVRPDAVTVLRNRPEATAANEAVTRVCMEAANTLQAELQRTMAEAEGLDAADAEGMERMRAKLVAMKQQMDALAAALPRAEAESRHALAELNGYLRTKSLHGLYFADGVVLVGRQGFIKGDDAGFAAFMGQALRRAAQGAEDEKTKKALEKALKRYWKDDAGRPGAAGGDGAGDKNLAPEEQAGNGPAGEGA